jgi:hypothetical protein
MTAASVTVADPARDDNDNDNSWWPTLAFGIVRRAHQTRQGQERNEHMHIYVKSTALPTKWQTPHVQGAYCADANDFTRPLPSAAITLLHILLAFTHALPAHKITSSTLCHIMYL